METQEKPSADAWAKKERDSLSISPSRRDGGSVDRRLRRRAASAVPALFRRQQLAEDAFQETMVKAWRALPDFRGESGAKTWSVPHRGEYLPRWRSGSGWIRMRKKKRAAGGHAGAGRAKDER